MTKQVFNTFWHGGQLSPFEWACLCSFVENGHTIRLFCYEPVVVPPGVSVESASDILPDDQLFESEGGFAAFSDIFRYELILKYGEWWVDSDVYCLKKDIPNCDYAWALEDARTINGAILKFPAHDTTLQRISKIAQDRRKITTDWCQLGPAMLTNYLIKSNINSFGTTKSFYPIHWLEAFLFWLPDGATVQKRIRSSYFVHLWNSVLNRIGLPRDEKPPIGSFLRHICEPYFEQFQIVRDINNENHNSVVQAIKCYATQDWASNYSTQYLGYDVSKITFEKYFKI